MKTLITTIIAAVMTTTMATAGDYVCFSPVSQGQYEKGNFFEFSTDTDQSFKFALAASLYSDYEGYEEDLAADKEYYHTEHPTIAFEKNDYEDGGPFG